MECNPETVTAELLETYRRAGVNRLSFGVQSMAPHVLASLGRRHAPAMAEQSVRWARQSGFESVNLDLIFGAAGETVEDWAATVAGVLALEPDHVSAYALTVEPGTPLAGDRRRRPDDDDQADKYLLADGLFEAAGLHWYELSNWSAPGHECRHNQLYWAQGDYRGIGCAAHSHADGPQVVERPNARALPRPRRGGPPAARRRGPPRYRPAAARGVAAGPAYPLGCGSGRPAGVGHARRAGPAVGGWARWSAGADPPRPVAGQRGGHPAGGARIGAGGAGHAARVLSAQRVGPRRPGAVRNH